MFTNLLSLVVQHLVLVIQKQTSQDKSALALPFRIWFCYPDKEKVDFQPGRDSKVRVSSVSPALEQ